MKTTLHPQFFIESTHRYHQRWNELSRVCLFKFLFMTLAMGAFTPQFAQAADSFPSEGDPTVCSEFVESLQNDVASQQSMVNLIKVWFRQVQPDEIQIQEARERIQQKTNPFYEGTSVVAQQLRNAGDQILQKNSELNWVALLAEFETVRKKEDETQKTVKRVDRKTKQTTRFIETDSILPEFANTNFHSQFHPFQTSNGESYVNIQTMNFPGSDETTTSLNMHFYKLDPIHGKMHLESSFKNSEIKEKVSSQLGDLPHNFSFQLPIPNFELEGKSHIAYLSGSMVKLDIENLQINYNFTPMNLKKMEEVQTAQDIGNGEILFTTKSPINETESQTKIFVVNQKTDEVRSVGQFLHSAHSQIEMNVDSQGNLTWLSKDEKGLRAYTLYRDTLEFTKIPEFIKWPAPPNGSLVISFLPKRNTWVLNINLENGSNPIYQYNPATHMINELFDGNPQIKLSQYGFSMFEGEDDSLFLTSNNLSHSQLEVFRYDPQTKTLALAASHSTMTFGMSARAPYLAKGSNGRLFLITLNSKVTNQVLVHYVVLYEFFSDSNQLVRLDIKEIDVFDFNQTIHFFQSMNAPLNILALTRDRQLKVIQVPTNLELEE